MTQTATSSFLPGIELAPAVWTDRSELRFGFSRSSGPGGQNVNKVNTKTELRVRVDALHGLSERARERIRTMYANRITQEGDLLIVADSERTQEANRQSCLKRLRTLILAAIKEPKARRKTKPSKSSVRRRLDSKRARSTIKKNRARVE